jgi:hypothetical protein
MSDRPPTFLVTKEYRRFAEFCDACRRDRYIGVCAGPPGVGKTLSARHYAQWDDVEAGLTEWRRTIGGDRPPGLGDVQTLVYTPPVAATPRRVGDDVGTLVRSCNALVREARGGRRPRRPDPPLDCRTPDRRRGGSAEDGGAGGAARPL